MRSLAVVQWSRLGDVLQTRPLLRALKRSDPAAHVVLFADARYGDIVRLFPERPDYVPVNLTKWTGAARHASSHMDFLRGAADLFRVNGDHDFAEIYVLTRSNAAAVFAEMLRPQAIHGYRSEAGRLVAPDQMDWIEKQMAAGQPACVHLSDLWTTLSQGEKTPEWLEPLLQNDAEGRTIRSQKKRFAILCDAGEKYRRIPGEGLRKLAVLVVEGTDAEIMLLGQNGSSSENDPFPSEYADNVRITDFRGRTNLSDFCAHLAQSDLVVGPDTGGLHLAAALGVPVIGLYFGGADAFHTGPYAEKALVIQNPSWTDNELDNIAQLISSALLGCNSDDSTDGASVLTSALDEYGLAYKKRKKTQQVADIAAARHEFFERFAAQTATTAFPAMASPLLSNVAVIIPENGAASYTEELLPDLTKELGEEGEIILVCSGLSAIRPQANLPDGVRCTREPKALTFAEACNRGARETNRQWLLFLNNDTRLPSGTIKTLLAHADEKTLLSPVIRYPDGLIQNAGVAFGDDGVVEIAHGTKECNRTVPPDALSAVALLMSRCAFDEVQGFDETFRNGYEDLDLSLRAREQGYHICVAANADVVHYRGATPGRYDHDEANCSLFVQRWYSQLRRPLSVSPTQVQRNPGVPLVIVSDEPADAAGSRLRWIWPLEKMGLREGRDFAWAHTKSKETCAQNGIETLSGARTVVIFRPLQSRATQYAVVNAVADNHARLLVDSDDLFLGRVSGNSERAEVWRMFEKNYSELLAAADVITVSTRELQEHLRSHGHEASVIETLPSYQQLSESDSKKQNDGRFNMAFFGTPSHHIDLGSILPALEAVLEKYPNVWFHWWGCRPGELAYHPRVRQGGPSVTDYSLHLQRLHEFGLDLAVVPLLDSPFARAKSPVKFFEYASSGIPAVYSNVPPYQDVVADGRTGILASDDTSSWTNAVERLVGDQQLRECIRNEARSEVIGIMCDKKRTEQFGKTIERLLEQTVKGTATTSFSDACAL